MASEWTFALTGVCTVRRATTADAPLVESLDKLQLDLATAHLQLHEAEHPNLTLEDWKKDLALGGVPFYITRSKTVVILYATSAATTQVVGYVSFQLRNDEARGKHCHINHLAVLESVRGTGIGNSLLAAAGAYLARFEPEHCLDLGLRFPLRPALHNALGASFCLPLPPGHALGNCFLLPPFAPRLL